VKKSVFLDRECPKDSSFMLSLKGFLPKDIHEVIKTHCVYSIVQKKVAVFKCGWESLEN
jgi:hypothetical protein